MKKLFLICSAIVFFVVGIIGTVHALPTNVALNGVASQSSTGYYGGQIHPSADLAIDDNTDSNYWNGSVTHTLCAAHSWWEVDLLQEYAINEIDIYNRTDMGHPVAVRLVPFNLLILDANYDIVWSETTYQLPSSIHDPLEYLPLNITGQYVKVRLNTVNYLHLAEVQVWSEDGGTPSVPEPATMVLLGTCLAGLGIIKQRKLRKE